jgi:hypothetical protein
MQNLLAINDINEKINAKAQQPEQPEQPEQPNDLYEVISVQLMMSRL